MVELPGQPTLLIGPAADNLLSRRRRFPVDRARSSSIITPKAGSLSFHTREQRFRASQREAETRSLPIFSVDSGMSFERETTLAAGATSCRRSSRGCTICISRSAHQTQLPVFDSALKDFNFTSIFARTSSAAGTASRDANQLTAAIAARLLDAHQRRGETASLIGQRYYFEQPQGHAGQQFADQPCARPTSSPIPPPSPTCWRCSSASLYAHLGPDSGVQYGGITPEFQRFNIALQRPARARQGAQPRATGSRASS